jgi:hypothetical protein
VHFYTSPLVQSFLRSFAFKRYVRTNVGTYVGSLFTVQQVA